MDDLQLSREEASIILDGEIGTSDGLQANPRQPQQDNQGHNLISAQVRQQQQHQQPDPSSRGNAVGNIGTASLNQPQQHQQQPLNQQQRAMQNATVSQQQLQGQQHMFGTQTMNPYGAGHQAMHGSHPSQWDPRGPLQAVARPPQAPVAAFPQPGQQRHPMNPLPLSGMQAPFMPYTMAQGLPAGMTQTPWPHPQHQHPQVAYRPPIAPLAATGAVNIPRNGMFVGANGFVQNGQTFGAVARKEPWKNGQRTASVSIQRKRRKFLTYIDRSPLCLLYAVLLVTHLHLFCVIIDRCTYASR